MHGTDDIHVGHLSDDLCSAWDDFVHSREEGSFFHLSGWRTVMEQAFGHKTHFLIAWRKTRIVGVLPLVLLSSRLFGKSLISNAFCVYGGPLAEDSEVLAALDAQAVALAETYKVGHVEYRMRQSLGAREGWVVNDSLYATFRKPITADHEINLKEIPRKQRAMVRKGIKAGLAGSVTEDADALHAIYAESVRNLGTPVFSRRYFRTLKEVFGDKCEMVLIRKDNQTVAGVMSFLFRDEVLPYYGGGNMNARALAANDFMYWDVMCRAADQGVRMFDFGRSKVDTGAYHFKKHWGFVPETLHYAYRLVTAEDVPDINPLNPKYRMAIKTWQSLPLWITNRLGPYISRSLG